jgi:hypothetical protein
MVEEQIIRNIHENKENRPDSLEMGTPSKGGVVKIYFNASHDRKETELLIDNALAARTYLQGKMV